MSKKIIQIKQKAKTITEQESIILTKKLFLRIIDLLHTPSDIISIDETGFNNFLSRKYGWAPIGENKIELEELDRTRNTTVVVAVSKYYGLISYQILENPVN